MAQPQTTSSAISSLLKQDPKKASALAVLLAVLLGLWGKMALSGGQSTPKAASAMSVPQAAPAPAATTDNKPKSTDAIGMLREWIAEPLPQGISRNLFELKLDYYPM